MLRITRNLMCTRLLKKTPPVDGIETGNMLAEGWKEKHASESESIIKAERSGKKQSVEEMQKESVDFVTRASAPPQVTRIHFRGSITETKTFTDDASPPPDPS